MHHFLAHLSLAHLSLAPLFLTICFSSAPLQAHPFHLQNSQLRAQDPFRQLEELWPTPNEVRTASGAPGPQYWQQKVDYEIDVRIDDQHQRLEGEERIHYHNHSPHSLSYLWIQLEQNKFTHNSLSNRSQSVQGMDSIYYGSLRSYHALKERPGGHEIHWVRDRRGRPLKYTIVDTMMRVDLPNPIKSGEDFIFSISWAYQIMKHKEVWGRSGYEELEVTQKTSSSTPSPTSSPTSPTPSPTSSPTSSPAPTSPSGFIEQLNQLLSQLYQSTLNTSKQTPKESLSTSSLSSPSSSASTPPFSPSTPSTKLPPRRLYEIAQWFPRLAAYTDVTGWQNKPFLGNGEFTLEFGDYLVRITVPDTHLVAATGELQNPEMVLTSAQQSRLKLAIKGLRPRFISTPNEVSKRERTHPKEERTWIFKAQKVRDFAFASSSTFIWDAWGHSSEGRKVLAMSFYPREAEPLWSRYSTQSIVHTLEVYERFTFPYPYPVAISVNGPVGGMEYPMICFNGPRPNKDKTYSKRTKYGLISVIIHEVGHFFFPMIVNSDERQWTWLDEGINTFLQYQAEREWEPNYPSWRGEPKSIINYMKSDDQVPIMTNSESLLQFGDNGYGKPAAALSVLRESVIGPNLFDQAFREYSKRWRFKRPMPSDFFRTMEDTSGVDLDWFWRGWFYSILPVDIAITEVTHYRLNTKNPEVDKKAQQLEKENEPKTLVQIRDEGLRTRVDRYLLLVTEIFYFL